MANQERAFTRPLDRSLEAYKAWIQNMVIRLGGKTGTLTDEQWEQLHAEFWAEAGNEEDAA